MTTVVAVVAGETVVMGADSLATIDGMVKGRVRKILQIGEWLVGMAGAVSVLRVLRAHESTLASAPTAEEFTERLMAKLIESGFASLEATEPEFECCLLLAKGGDLWQTGAELYPISAHGAVIGSGREIGRGALHALMKSCPDMDAESVVNRVLDACDELDVYTGAPYHVESTGGKKVGKTVGLTVVSDD